MSTTKGRTPAERLADRRAVAEDFALETLLAIEHAWDRAHADGEPTADRWGEGPSRLRLADLGFDPRLRREPMVGLCPRHGQFLTEWTGILTDRPPEDLRCTILGGSERCELRGPVSRTFVGASAA